MSAALAEPIVKSPETLSLVPAAVQPDRAEQPADPHPLVPVFIAGGIALAGAVVLVGWILMWLALRHTGINASW